MLLGIPKILSPELIKVLAEMGHGDEIVIADANFPAESTGKKVIRADGVGGVDMLKAILKVIPLDTYSDANVFLMETINGDPTPTIWEEYKKVAYKMDKNAMVVSIPRPDFYKNIENVYAIIATSESKTYANVILRKGVIK